MADGAVHCGSSPAKFPAEPTEEKNENVRYKTN